MCRLTSIFSFIVQDKCGDTALHNAVQGRKTESVSILLKANADPTLLNFSLATPIHQAAIIGFLPWVLTLYESVGCSVILGNQLIKSLWSRPNILAYHPLPIQFQANNLILRPLVLCSWDTAKWCSRVLITDATVGSANIPASLPTQTCNILNDQQSASGTEKRFILRH